MKEFFAIVFTLLIPALVSWLKRCDWPGWKKSLLSLAVCLVAGALSVAADSQFSWTNLAGTAGAIFTMATVLYHTWFKETELNRQLEKKDVL